MTTPERTALEALGVARDEYALFRPKRRWCPEWLWRAVRPLVRWEPFLTLFTESPDPEDWGR